MRIIFFDTETTGNQLQDRLCQLAIKDRGVDIPILNATYNPPVPISIESMAVHHITPKMLLGRPLFADAPEYADVKELFESDDVIAVAHNVAFDVAMLEREGIRVKNPLCTYKVARALDRDDSLANFQLQYLRYFLGIEVEANAHDAWGDVVVLEALFDRLLAKMAEEKGSEADAISEMLTITSQPMLIGTFRFGKHKDKKIAQVAREDRGYLEWLLNQKKQNPAEEADWIYTLEFHLK